MATEPQTKVDTIKVNERSAFLATVWRRFALIQMYGGKSKLVKEAQQVVADSNDLQGFDGLTISQMLPVANKIDEIYFKLLQDGKIGEGYESK